MKIELPTLKEIKNSAPLNPDAEKIDVLIYNWFIAGALWAVNQIKIRNGIE